MNSDSQETRLDIFDLDNDETQRQFIRNIVDSYHHDWDVLAELCQNAVDAIREKNPANGKIHVRFDRKNRTIEVMDTGVGMNREKVARALSPNVTFKRGQAKLIGEKGLGLTFCAFRANRITIETSIGDGSIHTVVFEGGRDWVEERRTTRPEIVLSTRQEVCGSFTKVSAQDVIADFDLERRRLRHLLLTKTALGSTYAIWPASEKKDGQIEILLSVLPNNGSEETENLAHRYWHPADHLLHKKTLQEVKELAQNNKIRDFKGWGLTDSEKYPSRGKLHTFTH